MAAILKRFEHASCSIASRSEWTRRVENDLSDRRALTDVMAVSDSIHASDDEVWMISYMDIMTLLLTLFVLLLAFSKISPETSESPAPATEYAVVQHTPPPMQPAAINDVVPDKSPHRFTVITLPKPFMPNAKVAAVPAKLARQSEESTLKSPVSLALLSESPGSTVVVPLKAAAKTESSLPQDQVQTALPSAREKFLDEVQASALGNRIELTADQDNVNLEISDNILFDPGSATLKSHGQQLLNELAALLVAQDYSVSVEGHSDDAPFNGALFASNWELSATRATNVTRYLISHGIAAARLRAIGYADTHPRADNASAEGRARNRRVSLVLHMPMATAAQQKNTDHVTGHTGLNVSLNQELSE